MSRPPSAAARIDAQVVVIGTGGFAIEFGAVATDAGWRVAGYVGPRPERLLPAAWLGDDDSLAAAAPGIPCLVAIGDPAIRRRLAEKIEAVGRTLGTFLHPRAWIAADVSIAPGVIVYPNATVHAGVVLGKGTFVNSNATIGHETAIGAFATIGPGVALGGRMRIGTESYFGIGSTAIENLTIAAGAVIGAGAALARDLPRAGTYVGVPAHPIRHD